MVYDSDMLYVARFSTWACAAHTLMMRGRRDWTVVDARDNTKYAYLDAMRFSKDRLRRV